VEKDLRDIGLSECMRYSLDQQKKKEFLVEWIWELVCYYQKMRRILLFWKKGKFLRRQCLQLVEIEHFFSCPTTVASENIVSPNTASCMKPGVDEKPNFLKRASLGMQHIWQMKSLNLLKDLSK
jgi:hypothetical protein